MKNKLVLVIFLLSLFVGCGSEVVDKTNEIEQNNVKNFNVELNEQYDISNIDFDNLKKEGDNKIYLFCLDVCEKNNITYGKNVYGKYILCVCKGVDSGGDVYIDNSGKVINKEEAWNRYCNYKKEHGMPIPDC